MCEKLSTIEMLERWEARREIQNIMGRFTNALLLQKKPEWFSKCWTTTHEPCFGINEGWYQGREAVDSYFESKNQNTLLRSKLLQEAFPDHLGDKTDDEIYGVGLLDYKPLSNQIIEVAGDGKTAKGFWYVYGMTEELTKYGPTSYWTFGTFTVDFVLEGDDWKIWHMQYLEDVHSPCGSNWGEAYVEERPVIEGFLPMDDFVPAAPSVPTVLREYYHKYRPFTKTPRLPEPYTTFAETFSYGI